MAWTVALSLIAVAFNAGFWAHRVLEPAPAREAVHHPDEIDTVRLIFPKRWQCSGSAGIAGGDPFYECHPKTWIEIRAHAMGWVKPEAPVGPKSPEPHSHGEGEPEHSHEEK